MGLIRRAVAAVARALGVPTDAGGALGDVPDVAVQTPEANAPVRIVRLANGEEWEVPANG